MELQKRRHQVKSQKKKKKHADLNRGSWNREMKLLNMKMIAEREYEIAA